MGAQKLLIIVNPISGGGKGKTVFENAMKPILEAKKINYFLQLTDSEGHAFRLAAALDLDEYSGIVAVSGDGMFHEIINGIYSRSDREEAFAKLKLGIIPAGTGNGLGASFGFGRDVEQATELLSGENTLRIDALVVKKLDGTILTIGALCCSWGFIADHDMLTEKKYRWMGPTISSILAPISCFIGKKVYKGKISFIPSDETKDNLSSRIATLERDGDWFSFDASLWGLTACNTTHIATDVMLAPGAKMNDGCVDLVMMHSCGYWDGLTLLMGFEKGDHVTHPYIDIFQVKTFKVEPDGDDGYLDIDGELYPAESVTVELIPSLINVWIAEKSEESKSESKIHDENEDENDDQRKKKKIQDEDEDAEETSQSS